MIERDHAEWIGIRALAWLASNDEVMPVFLGATGAAADDLRQRANEPAFLVSVLDFLMMNDDWVVEFCDAEKLSYDSPMRARHSLPGGEEVNWT